METTIYSSIVDPVAAQFFSAHPTGFVKPDSILMVWNNQMKEDIVTCICSVREFSLSTTGQGARNQVSHALANVFRILQMQIEGTFELFVEDQRIFFPLED